MIANVAIAIAAGCASALMYASVISRVRVSLALLYCAVTFIASLPGGIVYALQRSTGPLRQPTAASRDVAPPG